MQTETTLRSRRPNAVLATIAALAALVAIGGRLDVAVRASGGQVAPGLRVVVIAGDGGVNALRQKRFVTPIVEVRDDADRPLSGVPVRFVVRGGTGAFLNGQTALTVSTNGEGRATIPAFEPTTVGPLAIEATASFRGQTASVVIAQTTLASAAGPSTAPALPATSSARRSAPGAAGGASAPAPTIAGDATPTRLRIVVIVGEDAVNVIQQKTAVGPIVEVRDRNDLPVAGAAVTFAVVGRQAAFSGGLAELTVVTNTAGRAAASGLTPITSGSYEIGVTASYQGQTAATTIGQTNFQTAAEAARATQASSTPAQSSGSSAATSGGLSKLAVVGIAVGGAATAVGVGLVAAAVLSKEDCLYSVSPASIAIPGAGGSQTLTISATPSDCEPVPWSVSGSAGFLSVNPSSGSGPATVVVSAGANNTGVARSGSLSISGGQTVTVSQATNATPCGGPSTQAGNDAPFSRGYDVGRTSGTFTFSYDTQSQPDRITVTHENRLLHDSGCVGTGGTRAFNLSFSGSSSIVTVSVTPNCAGGSGTAWSFTVECPR